MKLRLDSFAVWEFLRIWGKELVICTNPLSYILLAYSPMQDQVCSLVFILGNQIHCVLILDLSIFFIIFFLVTFLLLFLRVVVSVINLLLLLTMTNGVLYDLSLLVKFEVIDKYVHEEVIS